MYLLVNIATLWLTIIGVDYSKNKNKYAKKLEILKRQKVVILKELYLSLI